MPPTSPGDPQPNEPAVQYAVLDGGPFHGEVVRNDSGQPLVLAANDGHRWTYAWPARSPARRQIVLRNGTTYRYFTVKD